MQALSNRVQQNRVIHGQSRKAILCRAATAVKTPDKFIPPWRDCFGVLNKKGLRTVAPEEAKQLLASGKWVLLDVRCERDGGNGCVLSHGSHQQCLRLLRPEHLGCSHTIGGQQGQGRGGVTATLSVHTDAACWLEAVFFSQPGCFNYSVLCYGTCCTPFGIRDSTRVGG